MDTMATGEQIMGELMGTDYLERRKEQRNGFNDVLQDYSAEVCFGRIWARRPGPETAQRDQHRNARRAQPPEPTAQSPRRSAQQRLLGR